jgi:acetyl-CoA synthetase
MPEVSDTAAVAVTPLGGGPSVLWIFAVLRGESPEGEAAILERMRQVVRRDLNPLFKIERLVALAELPRTASNKIMRRTLRDQAAEMLKSQAAPAKI